MKPVEISVYGRPLGGKTTLMAAFKAICLKSPARASITYHRNADGDVTNYLLTEVSGVPARFTWYPGNVMYPEAAMKMLLETGQIGVCLFDPLYDLYREFYYGELFTIAKEVHEQKNIPWVYALNMIDQLTTEVRDLDLPVNENLLSRISAWQGTGVVEFLERIALEVKKLPSG